MVNAIRLESFCSVCAQDGRETPLLLTRGSGGLAQCPRCGHTAPITDAWGTLEDAWMEREAKRQADEAFWTAWGEDLDRELDEGAGSMK
jgi:hypothetical protein